MRDLQQRIWNAFFAPGETPPEVGYYGPAPDLDAEYLEGKQRLAMRQHLVRERDQASEDDAKKAALARDPLLRCECCGFSFVETHGVEYIEAHHRVPV